MRPCALQDPVEVYRLNDMDPACWHAVDERIEQLEDNPWIGRLVQVAT